MKSSHILFTGLFLSLTLFLAGCSSQSTGADVSSSGRITALSGNQFDWGDINIQGGKVTQVFEFQNDSKTNDLYLKSAQTSCMCTTARYRLADDSFSPVFGMHNNPTSWSAPIAPGEKFKVEVVFDPLAHGPEATGPIQRSIQLATSDPDHPVTELKVSGMVLSEEAYKIKHP